MKKVILTAGMLLWAVHPALAQSADPSLLIHEQFAKIDTNGDGEISEEEFLDYKMEETKKVTAKGFSKLGTDKSGGISEEEYSQTVSNIINQLKKLSQGMTQSN